MSIAIQVVIFGLATGTGVALGAMSFTVVYATTRHFHVAQAAVVAVGAYATVVVLEQLHLAWPMALVLACLTTGVVGTAVYLLVYRRLDARGGSVLAIFIGSLGAMIIIQNALAITFGVHPRLGDIDWLANRHQLAPGIGITNTQIVTLLLGLGTWYALNYYLTRTRGGAEVQATADDPSSAAVVGIDVPGVHMRVYWVASLALGPLAFITVLGAGADPYGGTREFILAAIAGFMGGRGSVTGAYLAGLSFGVVEAVSVLVLSAEWQTTIALGLFVVVLMLRPQGLARVERSLGV